MIDVRTEVVVETGLGVTPLAQLLLGYMAKSISKARSVDTDYPYRVIEAHSAKGTLLIEQASPKNTFVVSVVQLTGVTHV